MHSQIENADGKALACQHDLVQPTHAGTGDDMAEASHDAVGQEPIHQEIKDFYQSDYFQKLLRSFSLDAARAEFLQAGFREIAVETETWQGSELVYLIVERNGVPVQASCFGCDVFAPGNGHLMACVPGAATAIRFVGAFEQEADLMAAAELDDEQFNRVQELAGRIIRETLAELEARLERIREWSEP